MEEMIQESQTIPAHAVAVLLPLDGTQPAFRTTAQVGSTHHVLGRSHTSTSMKCPTLVLTGQSDGSSAPTEIPSDKLWAVPC